MGENHNKPVTFNLTAGQYAWLSTYAKKQRRNVSDTIRSIILDMMDANPLDTP